MQEDRKLSSSQWRRSGCEGDIGKWKLSVADAIICRKDRYLRSYQSCTILYAGKIHNHKKEIFVFCRTGSELQCFIIFFRKISIFNLHKIVILFETAVQFPSISKCFIFKSSKSHFIR